MHHLKNELKTKLVITGANDFSPFRADIIIKQTHSDNQILTRYEIRDLRLNSKISSGKSDLC
jgi:hypothetical protein